MLYLTVNLRLPSPMPRLCYVLTAEISMSHTKVSITL
jgi:hypothetical protein